MTYNELKLNKIQIDSRLEFIKKNKDKKIEPIKNGDKLEKNMKKNMKDIKDDFFVEV